MLNQIAQQGIRKPVFVGPLCIAEDGVKRVRVRLLDAAHGGLERLTDILRDLPHIPPVAVVGNLEAVVLREQGTLFVTGEFLQRSLVLVVVDV